MKQLISLFLTVAVIATSWAQKKPIDEINRLVTQTEAEAHLSFLSADEMRGRDTGSKELDIAANYIAGYFKQLGMTAAPGAANYFQTVELERTTVATQAVLKIDTSRFKLKDNFLVMRGADLNWNGELVYAGYGSKEELTEEIKGKVVVVLAGARDMTNQRSLFSISSEKSALAAKLGAVAMIEILVTPPFPWPGLVSYFGSGSKIGAKSETNDIPVIWLKEAEASAIVKLKEAKKATGSLQVSGIKRTPVPAKNVVGIIEGSDPVLKKEYLAISAHYDHVGVGRKVAGDSIYNGARDNAIGIVGLMETAKFFTTFKPKRSVIFIAVTAEEKGLLGSAWYADHPLVPLNQTVFNFNCDGAGYNDKSIVMVNGLERTTAEGFLNQGCSAFGLKASLDPVPEQNLYERSDNYNFAKKGVPAINFSPGVKAFDQELMKYYHQPADEFASLDMEYLTRYFKAYVYTNYLIANSTQAPWWKPGDKFETPAKELYKK